MYSRVPNRWGPRSYDPRPAKDLPKLIHQSEVRVLSGGWLRYVPEFWLDGNQCDLSKRLPRKDRGVQRVEAQYELDAVEGEPGVVVVVVFRIKLDGHEIRKLLDGGVRHTRTLQALGVQHNVDVAAEGKSESEDLLSVVTIGVERGQIRQRTALPHRFQGGLPVRNDAFSVINIPADARSAGPSCSASARLTKRSTVGSIVAG